MIDFECKNIVLKSKNKDISFNQDFEKEKVYVIFAERDVVNQMFKRFSNPNEKGNGDLIWKDTRLKYLSKELYLGELADVLNENGFSVDELTCEEILLLMKPVYLKKFGGELARNNNYLKYMYELMEFIGFSKTNLRDKTGALSNLNRALFDLSLLKVRKRNILILRNFDKLNPEDFQMIVSQLRNIAESNKALILCLTEIKENINQNLEAETISLEALFRR